MQDEMITSRLTRVEVFRTITKSAPELRASVEIFFQRCYLIGLEPVILRIAENYPAEITLKSSDAIHVATAQTIARFIEGIVTLDKQMASNATRLGLHVYEAPR